MGAFDDLVPAAVATPPGGGAFDDLIPNLGSVTRGNAPRAGGGAFDDLIPSQPGNLWIPPPFLTTPAPARGPAVSPWGDVAGQRDDEFLRTVVNDPGGVVKAIPEIAMGIATAPGKLAYHAAADAVSKVTGQREYGGNLAAGMSGAPLPVDKFLAEVSKTNPKLATSGKLGQSLSAMAPLGAVGMLPAGLAKLAAAGFSAQMIAGAPAQFKEYAEEINKPPAEQDPDRVTTLQSDILQTLAFAPLAGAGSLHGIEKAGEHLIPRGQGIAPPKSYRALEGNPLAKPLDNLAASVAELQAAISNPFKPAAADLSADTGGRTSNVLPSGESGTLAEIERAKAETQQRQDRIAASQPYTTSEASQDLPALMESLKAELEKNVPPAAPKAVEERSPFAPAAPDQPASDSGSAEKSADGAGETSNVLPEGAPDAAARAARLDALETANELGMLSPEQETELAQLRRDNGSEGTSPVAPVQPPAPPSPPNVPLTPFGASEIPIEGAAAETITGQNERPGSEATGRASGPEPMPAEVPAAKAVITPKPRPASRLSPLTDEDGLLYHIIGGYGKIPIFVPDPLTLANWQRLKAKGPLGRSAPEEAYWRRLQERFPPNFEDDYGVNGEDAITAYRAARRAGIDVETFKPNDGGAQGLDLLLEFVRRETGREITARDLWAHISGVAHRHETGRVTGKQAEQFNSKVLRGERPKAQRSQVERFASSDLREGDSFTVQGQTFEVREHDRQDGTPIVKLRDGPKFGEQTVYGNEPIHVDKGSFESGPDHDGTPPQTKSKSSFLSEETPLFGQPESVAEQRARVALEQKRKSEAAQRDDLQRRAAKPLVGKAGDLGQGDLLGGGDLFSLRDDPDYVESRKPELDAIAQDLYRRPYDYLPEADQGKVQVTLEHEDARPQRAKDREALGREKIPREVPRPPKPVGEPERSAPPAGETSGQPARPVQPSAPAPETPGQSRQLKDRRAATGALAQEIFRQPLADLGDVSRAHVREELKRGRRAGEVVSDPIEKQLRDLWDQRARAEGAYARSASRPGGGIGSSRVNPLAQIREIDGRLAQLREISNAAPEQKARWIRKFMEGDAPSPRAKPLRAEDRRAATEALAQEIFRQPFADLGDVSRAHVREELKRGRRAGEIVSDTIERQLRDLWDERARAEGAYARSASKPGGGMGFNKSNALARFREIDGRLTQLREIANGTPEQKARWIEKFLEGDTPTAQDTTRRLIKGSTLEQWADEKIGQGRLFTGLDPELLAAYAIKGAALIEGGVRDFAAWSAQMLKDFGEAVRPHLEDLFARAQRRLTDIRAHHDTPHEGHAKLKDGANSVAEDRAAVSQAMDELRDANRLANQPADRTSAGVSKEAARSRRTAATAALHEAQEKLWHNPEFVEETMRRQMEVTRERKTATDPDRKAELDQEFESLTGDLEQSPKRLVSAIAKKLMKWGAIKRQGEAEAGSQHPGTESPESGVPGPESQVEIAPEHTQKAARARAAQTLRELPARTREFFHAANGVRRRIANTWAARQERDTITSTYDAAENGGSVFGRQASNEVLHALNRSFGAAGEAVQARNPMRESALTFVIESGRDLTALDEAKLQIKGSAFARSRMGKRALAAIDFAETHWDRLAPAAELYAKITDAQVEHENIAGQDILYRKGGYVMHLQDMTADASQLDVIGSGGGFGPDSPFKKVRDHATYADAIGSGVVPKTLNAVDLLQKRLSMGQTLINHGAWVDGMRRILDPKTQLPIVTEMQTHIRKDGKKYQAPPPGYQQMIYAGQDFAVHKPYDALMKLLVTPSTVRTSLAGHVALEMAGGIKHGMLVFDSYHLGRLAFWNAMVRGSGLPGNPFAHRRGLTLLDQTMPEIQRMIAAKEIPAAFGRDLVESKRQLSLLISKGLNVGGVADNIATHFVQNLPIAGRFNRFLFQQFQRGATAEASLIELRRIQKMQPNVPEAVLARRVALDLNTRFGNLQNQSWIKNKTYADLLRIFNLAPQWNESLIRSELGAVKQLGLAIPDSVRNRRLAVGTLGRAVFTAAVGTFMANQILNYITRGKPTWENPEEGYEAKLSAWIPDLVGNGPGFFNNPLTLPAEMSSLLLKKTERSGDFPKALAQVLASRLGPLGRVPYTLFVREDELGAKLKTGGDVAWQMLSGLMPLPISGGTLARAGTQLVTGRPEEKYPGQFQHQVFQTFGVKLDAAPDAGQRIARLATAFNRAKGITPNAIFFHGDYYDLDSALRVGNQVRIKAALDEVLQKRTPDAVRTHYKTWARARFTGKLDSEAEFQATLNPEQTQTYERALAERERLRDQVDGLLP